jgi:hypothetical protein
MKLLHASQIGADITCLQECLDWLFDADAAGISGWAHYRVQQRLTFVLARLYGMAVYVEDWRVTRYMALVTLAGILDVGEVREVRAA